MRSILKNAGIAIYLLVLHTFSFSAFSQDTLSVMTYNVLKFGEDDTDRVPYFKTVIENTAPDILVIQEILSEPALELFADLVMEDNFAAGDFIDGADSDNGILYKTDLFEFLGNSAISTSLRDINEFSLIYSPTGDTIRIYSVHLKASSGNSNQIKRLQEVEALRAVTNQLPEGSLFMVCGDFNIYGSYEPAYQALTSDNGMNDGHVIDPLSLTGTWNNQAYSIHHTQSTRTRQFDGGAAGGLDDRFSMILYSQGIAEANGLKYIENSTFALGNDGQHYNDSINHPPNAAATQALADALHYASDHLPVMARFVTVPQAIAFQLQIEPGWSGVSTFFIPVDRSLQSIFEQVGEDFNILLGDNGIYYPAGGLQTIFDWEYTNGYVVHVDQQVNIDIQGHYPDDRSIQIKEGWNTIPVLSDHPVLTEEVFYGHLSKIEIIRQIAGPHLFWPEKGINTLPYLMPGKAYFLKSRSDFEVGF